MTKLTISGHTTGRHATRFAMALVALALGGCAGGDLVVLLPGDDGRVGAVEVSTGGQAVTLNTANAAARGAESVGILTADDIQSTFGEALAAEAPVPLSYQLYFQSGSTELEASSLADFEAMLVEVRNRAVVDVQLTGHTDRVGTLEGNDQLALRRAMALRDKLLDLGLTPEQVSAVGRGEREPLVPTADEVAEARNRRVQVFVR